MQAASGLVGQPLLAAAGLLAGSLVTLRCRVGLATCGTMSHRPCPVSRHSPRFADPPLTPLVSRAVTPASAQIIMPHRTSRPYYGGGKHGIARWSLCGRSGVASPRRPLQPECKPTLRTAQVGLPKARTGTTASPVSRNRELHPSRVEAVRKNPKTKRRHGPNVGSQRPLTHLAFFPLFLGTRAAQSFSARGVCSRTNILTGAFNASISRRKGPGSTVPGFLRRF